MQFKATFLKYLLDEAMEQSGFKAWVLNLNGPGSDPGSTIYSSLALGGCFACISCILFICKMEILTVSALWSCCEKMAAQCPAYKCSKIIIAAVIIIMVINNIEVMVRFIFSSFIHAKKTMPNTYRVLFFYRIGTLLMRTYLILKEPCEM